MNQDPRSFRLFHLLSGSLSSPLLSVFLVLSSLLSLLVLSSLLSLLVLSSLSLLSLSSYVLRKNRHDLPKDPSMYAVKLPLIAYWLKEEQQADLIEIRECWYGDRPLNFWTHISVGFKTQQYLIYDYFWFYLRQKFLDRFQPMKKERLPRIKNTD